MSACWDQPSRSFAAPKLKRFVHGAGSAAASAATPARCREFLQAGSPEDSEASPARQHGYAITDTARPMGTGVVQERLQEDARGRRVSAAQPK